MGQLRIAMESDVHHGRVHECSRKEVSRSTRPFRTLPAAAPSHFKFPCSSRRSEVAAMTPLWLCCGLPCNPTHSLRPLSFSLGSPSDAASRVSAGLLPLFVLPVAQG